MKCVTAIGTRRDHGGRDGHVYVACVYPGVHNVIILNDLPETKIKDNIIIDYNTNLSIA